MSPSDFTPQEAPRCPDNVQRGILEFDRRLRVTFNTHEGVWQIQEQVQNTGQWTHVLFWHDGPWQQMKYRPLPFTAGPLIEEVTKRDMLRVHRCDSVKSLARKCDAIGAAQRASRLARACEERNEKARKYADWAYRNAERLTRMYAKGGRSAQAAIQERTDALCDLGLSRNG